MRIFSIPFLTASLCVALVAHSARAASFPRTAHFLINEAGQALKVDAYFAVEKDGTAYYWADVAALNSSVYGSSRNEYLRLTPTAAGVQVMVQRPSERKYWQATLPAGPNQSAQIGLPVEGVSKIMPGPGAANLGHERRERELTGVDVLYGYDWDLSQAMPSGQSLSVTLLASLDRGPDGQAHESVTVSGPAQYFSCDGCEHADQLFVESWGIKVNLATLNFGKFADFGCEGNRHPWIDQLIALGVPFAFRGELTVLSQDLWEGDYWTAVRAGSLLGLGKNPKTLPLVSFLDAIVQVDPQMEGSFVSYHDELLTYRHDDAEMIFDLNSAQMISRRR